MPYPSCPDSRPIGYYGPDFGGTFGWPDRPAAFAEQVAWSCVPVHYEYPTNMKWGFEPGYPNVDMSARMTALGGYAFPNAVFTRKSNERGFTPGVFSPEETTDPRVNPWSFIATMRVMDDDTLDGSHQDTYVLYGSFLSFTGGLGAGDASPVPGTSPTQYATAFSASGETVGRYFDTGAGYWKPIPGGTSGALSTFMDRLGSVHPEQSAYWTGYLAFNLPPLDLPFLPDCPPKADDPFHFPTASKASELWFGPFGTPQRKQFQWRGGSTDATEVLLTGTVPAGGPWKLAVGVNADPMGRVFVRRNGGDWLAGVADPFPFGGGINLRWSLHWSAGDTAEIGVMNASSGDWDPDGYTDPRMGRVTVTPEWVVCAGLRRGGQFHLG